MTRRFMAIAIFLLTAITGSTQNYVTLFENCNYSGSSYFLQPGTYRGYQMKIGNDRLSSIQVPAGMKITIYEHDEFKGRAQTYSSSVYCLESDWNEMTSSLVIESTSPYGNNNNDFVTFYNDCNSRGYSRSLGPGTYTAEQLGSLRENISSFIIYGNLQVKAYTGSNNASGYSYTFEQSQTCLSSTYNDKIRSLVIEYRYGGGNTGGNNGNNNNYSNAKASFYTDCNYNGNSVNLGPGYYQGDKLGLFKYDISSVEIPSNLRVKVFVNNEYLSGSSYTLNENYTCLSGNMNDRIGSILIEERGYGGGGYGGNNPPGSSQRVIIYTNENYQGQSAALLPGTYSNMSMINFPDKSLSSLQVPDGYRVVIYDQENFGGKSYTITDSKSRFYLSGWNDKASSIAVYRDR